jgi:hypothetical protein
VFISHVHTDEAWADSIANILRAAGYDVDLPREAIPTGEPITRVIQNAVTSAEQVVVLVSEASSASPWVRAEIALALAAGKPVLPVRVEPGAPLPAELAQSLFIDAAASPVNEAAYRVIQALSGHQPPAPPRSQEPPSTAISPLWVNRAEELSQIDAALSAARAAGDVPLVVLVGDAGVGKTTIARQFVATHQQDFPTVRWLSAPSLVGSAELPGEETKGGKQPNLLIIDDVDSYHEVARLLPSDRRVAVILTSRTRNWGPPFAVINVGPLTAADAADLLRRRLPRLGPADASRIVEDLGGLPLALDLVASLVERQSVSAVLDQLRAVTTAVTAAETAGQGSYYLDTNDPRVISAFERAFAEVVSPSGTVVLEAPERGSWKRRWFARFTGDPLDLLLDKAERAAEVIALTRPEGQANRDNAEAIARLLEASSAIPNMVVASGSVLLIKCTDHLGTRVFSKTLTATELRRFEENQHLLSQPAEALAFLQVLGTGGTGELTDNRVPKSIGPH